MTPLTRAEIEAAKARADAVLKNGCYDRANVQIPLLADTALYWQERCEQAMEWLMANGTHTMECSALVGSSPCICGLDAFLAEQP